QKLNILASASRFDLACACKSADEPGRVRGDGGQWIYPAALPNGRKVMLLKTLQTNACENDCTYCPFNRSRNLARYNLSPNELAEMFMRLRQAKLVTGLFLSSGVAAGPDNTMSRMLDTVTILRRQRNFRGFIHLKIVPGASDNAIEQAVLMATRVSVNIEAPNAERLARLSSRKNFHQGIIDTMRKINHFRHVLNRPHCSQTTQFVVGAAQESDREIVLATSRLYESCDMERVYFSAYQDPERETPIRQQMLFKDLPPELEKGPIEHFVREHRLYQVDFLFRRYGFRRDEITFDEQGNLPLHTDPKRLWADSHPEFFPVSVNRASQEELLRVPGFGPLSVKKILQARKETKIRKIIDFKELGIKSKISQQYVTL
ncbi:MAG: radical SAM protein, partial [Sedimentisphaerales bacterium]|nr:radical SAM protein [Sedimentisphaerales bacterium]